MTDQYRAAAAEVARWLASVAIEDGDGITWPTVPGADEPPAPQLGWGALGPMVFFADAYRTTGETAHLELARGGARWLRARLAKRSPDDEPGLFIGIAGFAVVFNELARLGESTDDDLAMVFERLDDAAVTSPAGTSWAGATEVLFGGAGIGFALLTIGRSVLGDGAIDRAARAGDWLLSVADETPHGLRWDMGEGVIETYPHSRDVWFPNFAHGTAGIAAFLARLGAAANDDRYVSAAQRAASWILTTCDTTNGAVRAWHHDPNLGPAMGIGPARDAENTSPLYTMGWCHGPPGLGWFFRELELATGDDRWPPLIAGTATALRQSGIPERREPGFWDNVGRCCGSAGVAEYLLDLHTWREEQDDLDFAVTMVDDLLDRATVDDAGMRWSNVEWRADPPVLPAETSLYQGASGIGLTLLRLARHLDADRSTVQWPHAPSWS